MQVVLDSSFARPGSAPIWGGKKGEFRDWTTYTQNKAAKIICMEEKVIIQINFNPGLPLAGFRTILPGFQQINMT